MNAALPLISVVCTLLLSGCFKQAECVKSEQSVDFCGTSASSGFAHYILQIKDSLTRTFIAIWATNSRDREVNDFYHMVTGSDFGNALKELRNTDEYFTLVSFLCLKVKFHIKHLDDFLQKLFYVTEKSESHFDDLGGIQNVFRSLFGALNDKQLRDAFKSALATDPLLAKQVEKLPPMLLLLIEKLRETVSFKRLMYLLTVANFPVSDAVDLVGTALGINNTENWHAIKETVIPPEMRPPYVLYHNTIA